MKKLLVLLLILMCGMTAFGQIKPKLGILPFTGGSAGESEVITTLFSYQNYILSSFTLVPITNAVTEIILDQDFQLSSYPDSDIITRLGRLLNVDFVVSGCIRNLGDRNVIIVNIINVLTLELVGGDYREYRKTEDLPALLPEMARNIAAVSQRNSQDTPRLAVAPFTISRDANVQEAESLAHILTIDIANSGKYTVLPRISTLEEIKRELIRFTQGDYTFEEETRAYGHATAARYLLCTEINRIEDVNLFSASIIEIEEETIKTEGYRNYQTIGEGADLMRGLSYLLTEDSQPEVQVTIVIPQTIIQPDIVEVIPEPIIQEPDPPKKHEPANNPYYWTIGLSVGSSFDNPWLVGTLHGTIAPIKYMFIELGCDAGFMSELGEWDFHSITPFAHLAVFIPYPKGGWYLGAGAAYMMTFDEFPEGMEGTWLISVTSGINILNAVNISYTIQTKPDFEFAFIRHKVSLGYTYRF